MDIHSTMFRVTFFRRRAIESESFVHVARRALALVVRLSQARLGIDITLSGSLGQKQESHM